MYILNKFTQYNIIKGGWAKNKRKEKIIKLIISNKSKSLYIYIKKNLYCVFLLKIKFNLYIYESVNIALFAYNFSSRTDNIKEHLTISSFIINNYL